MPPTLLEARPPTSLASARRFHSETLRPETRVSPVTVGTIPSRALSSVDFPDPLGPRTA